MYVIIDTGSFVSCMSLTQDVVIIVTEDLIVYVIIVIGDFMSLSRDLVMYDIIVTWNLMSCMSLLYHALSRVGHSYKGPNVLCVINLTTRCHVHYECQTRHVTTHHSLLSQEREGIL